MSVKVIAGSGVPVISGRTVSSGGDNPSCTVNVTGFSADLKSADPNDYVPSGYEYRKSNITTHGDGTGTLSIECGEIPSTDPSSNTIRVTYTITMSEVQTDLKEHPSITVAGRKEITMWLATDAKSRYDSNGNPQYLDSLGGECSVNDATAKKYIKAYEAGIETYNRYFPIIRKTSYIKKVPGLLDKAENKGVEGGSITFSAAGSFSPPDLSLTGYADTGWFKSGDEYQQNDNRTWTHTEEWTWTPEGSGSEHSWIYNGSQT